MSNQLNAHFQVLSSSPLANKHMMLRPLTFLPDTENAAICYQSAPSRVMAYKFNSFHFHIQLKHFRKSPQCSLPFTAQWAQMSALSRPSLTLIYMWKVLE